MRCRSWYRVSQLTFSEDYIQTLGVNFLEKTIHVHGNEINFSVCSQLTKDVITHLEDLGPGGTTRIRFYAPTSQQRCERHFVHVRPHSETHIE